MRLSWSHDLDYEFGELTGLTRFIFLCSFLIDFFSILFFNIELIEN